MHPAPRSDSVSVRHVVASTEEPPAHARSTLSPRPEGRRRRPALQRCPLRPCHPERSEAESNGSAREKLHSSSATRPPSRDLNIPQIKTTRPRKPEPRHFPRRLSFRAELAPYRRSAVEKSATRTSPNPASHQTPPLRPPLIAAHSVISTEVSPATPGPQHPTNKNDAPPKARTSALPSPSVISSEARPLGARFECPPFV